MLKWAGQLGRRVASKGTLQRAWWVLRRSCVCAYKDNVFGVAKGAAYSALLAIFPLLTTITALLVQANADSVAQALTQIIFAVIPPGTQDLIRANLIERGPRPVILPITGSIVSVLATSGVMLSLMEGFRAAYQIPHGRSFWKQRAVAAFLVITAALPVVVASTLIVFGGRAETLITQAIGLIPRGQELRGPIAYISGGARYLVALAGISFSIASLYRIGPNHVEKRKRSIWPGATLATVLWLLATIVFAWYVRNIARYNLMYGSIAAVIALLVWLYLISIIALIGCEFNAERDRLSAQGFEV